MMRAPYRRERTFVPDWQELEGRTLPSAGAVSQTLVADPAVPQPMPPLAAAVSGIQSATLETARTIGADGQDFFVVSPGTGNVPVTGGRIVVQVQSAGQTQVIMRSWPSGSMQSESDAPATGGADTRIDMYVTAAPVELDVSGAAGLPYSISISFTPSTAPGATVEGQASPYAPLVAADVTGSGIEDLITPEGFDLGLGNGTFQPVPGSALATPGSNPSAMIAADFTGDGRDDVAVSDASADDVTIFQFADGTFQTSATFGVGGTPVALATGNFTGSGRTGIAVLNQNPGEVQIFVPTGADQFQLAQTLSLAAYGISGPPQSIATGIFGANPQGPVDLAVAYGQSAQGSPGGALIFRGLGDGTFDATTTVDAGINPVSIVTGYFSDDGLLDLAVADEGNITEYGNFANFGGVSALQKVENIAANASSLPSASLGGLVILMGRADGTFEAMPEVPAGFLPGSLITGNFDSSQKQNTDIVVLHGLSTAASLLLGNGDGTFQPPIQVVPAFPAQTVVSGGLVHESAVGADFTGDGREGLAIAGSLSTGVVVMLGDGDGTFQGQSATATGDGPIALAQGDFNGDGIPDLVVANALSNTISIMMGDGDGGFRISQQLTTPLFTSSVAVADLNGDGKQDIVVTSAGASCVTVFMGNGDGTFVDAGAYPTGLVPMSVVAADLDGNGVIDIAVANAGSNTVSVLMGKGDGSFQPAQVYEVGQEPVSIAATDLDADGRDDLVVANIAGDSLSVLRNLGDGLFAPAVSVPVGSEPDNVVAANLTAQNTPYVIIANAAGGSVSILKSEGQNTSWGPGSLPLLPVQVVKLSVTPGADPISLAVADLTGNGIPDIAVADANAFSSGYVNVLYGNGDGTFSREEHYGEDSIPVAIAVADLTASSELPDLVVTQVIANQVDVLTNVNGSFDDTGAVSVENDSAPLVADFSTNGYPDVISLDAFGDILWRPGIGPEPATTAFGTPVTINQGMPSRGIALIPADPTPLVASLALAGNEIQLFGYRAGQFAEVGSRAVPPGSTQIFSADLWGNGQTELLVSNPDDGSIAVFDTGQQLTSVPALMLTDDVGLSDLALVSLDGEDPVLVASNQVSGQIQVFSPQNDFPYSTPLRGRNGTVRIQFFRRSIPATALEAWNIPLG